MSELRRRIVNVFRETPSPLSTSRESTPDPSEEVQLVPVSKLKNLSTRKSRKRRNGLIFGLGGVFGIILAVFFANQQDVIKLEGLMDLNLDSLLDVLPAGVVKDAKDITVRVLNQNLDTRSADEYQES